MLHQSRFARRLLRSNELCDRRYVFDAVVANGRAFNPTAACPPMSMPEPLRVELLAKDAEDRAQMLATAEQLDRREATEGASSIRLAFAGSEAFEHTALAPMSVAVGGLSLEAPGSESAPHTAPPIAVPTAEGRAGGPSTATVSAARSDPPPETTPALGFPVDSAFLPADLATPTREPLGDPSNAATLEERMLVGSEPKDARVEESYAAATEEDEALSGILLRSRKRKP